MSATSPAVARNLVVWITTLSASPSARTATS